MMQSFIVNVRHLFFAITAVVYIEILSDVGRHEPELDKVDDTVTSSLP